MQNYSQDKFGSHFYKQMSDNSYLHVMVGKDSWCINNIPSSQKIESNTVECSDKLFNEKLHKAIFELKIKDELLFVDQESMVQAKELGFLDKMWNKIKK